MKDCRGRSTVVTVIVMISHCRESVPLAFSHAGSVGTWEINV